MALGSIFLNNIYILKHRDASEKQKTMVVRIMIVITGVVAMAIASKLPNIINSANWSFAWITPLFFTLVFGLFWKQSPGWCSSDDGRFVDRNFALYIYTVTICTWHYSATDLYCFDCLYCSRSDLLCSNKR